MKPQLRISIPILIFVIANSLFTYAQKPVNTFQVSGYVSANENNEKMVGVNVYQKGTTNGTITNEKGYYTLALPEGETVVVFSFIGYKTQEKSVVLKGNKKLNVTLEPNEEFLEEISVVSQRKFFGNMDYGREIPTVKSSEIEKINSTNASDILHARLSGVWATKTSGAPGDQQKIRIRGQASFFSSAEPLYVIDGVPVPIVNLSSLGIGDLNMHDIESVTVLKDASSTALYGYQGGNGVVLIDTKQRSENKLSFTYKTGVQRFNNYYDLMNTKDFLESLEPAKKNIYSMISQYYPSPKFSENVCDNNRQEEIFQLGNIHEYQLSGGGRFKTLNYYLSGNYTTHKGVVKKSEQNKYNFTARVGTTIKNKLAINFSYRLSYQENTNNQNEFMGNRIIFEGINKAPCLECTSDKLLYKEDEIHTLNDRNHVPYDLINALNTPQSIFDSNRQSYNFQSNAASLMLRYSINQNLNVDVIESFMIRNSQFDVKSDYNKVSYSSFREKYTYYPYHVFMKSDERMSLFNHQLNVSYNKNIGQHVLNASLGHRYYIDNIWWLDDKFNDFVPTGFFLRNSMAGISKNGSVLRRMGSTLGHLSYNFRETYFISAVTNLSRIREGMYIDYYTLFPSVAFNWNIANEPFLLDFNQISELSFYFNFGESGNYPLNGLANDLFMQTLDARNPARDSTHLVVNQLANHFLQHETNREMDLGLKSAFFNDRLKLNAVYYKKQIGKQVVMRDIPEYYAGGKMFANLGSVDVIGYEIGFEASPVQSKNTSWILSGNFSSSRQVVKTLADHQDMRFISTDLLIPDFIIKEGGAMGDIYGYKYLGLWTAEDEAAQDNRYVRVKNYKFLNADSSFNASYLSEKDKTVIGNSIPKFNWNLTTSIRYKAFSVDVTLYSVWGMQKYNATKAATYISGVNRDLVPLYTDSIRNLSEFSLYQSSYFVEDAGFIRIKNISFSYEPQKPLWGLACRFTLSFENVYTYTKYTGYDPEASVYTDNNFSDNAIDRGAYPNPTSVFASVNIKF